VLGDLDAGALEASFGGTSTRLLECVELAIIV